VRRWRVFGGHRDGWRSTDGAPRDALQAVALACMVVPAVSMATVLGSMVVVLPSNATAQLAETPAVVAETAFHQKTQLIIAKGYALDSPRTGAGSLDRKIEDKNMKDPSFWPKVSCPSHCHFSGPHQGDSSA